MGSLVQKEMANQVTNATVSFDPSGDSSNENNVTPILQKHAAVIEFNPTADYAGGTVTVQFSNDDGTTWATLVDDNGDNVVYTAAAAGTNPVQSHPVQIPQMLRTVMASRSAGGVQTNIKAS